MSEAQLLKEIIELKARLRAAEELAIDKTRETDMLKAKMDELRRSGALKGENPADEIDPVRLLILAEQSGIKFDKGGLSLKEAHDHWTRHYKKTREVPR